MEVRVLKGFIATVKAMLFSGLLLFSADLLQAQNCQPVLNGAKIFLAFECLNDSTVLTVDSQKAEASGWQYAFDSSKDGVSFGQIGGGDFEIYGLAIRETSDTVYLVINGNLPLQGFFSNSAQDGNIGWGDIFVDLQGTAFKDRQDAADFFAIRFAGTNESGAPQVGVYSGVTAKSVTAVNSGFNSWQHYANHLSAKGFTPILGDLGANQTYYASDLNLNVIKDQAFSGAAEFVSLPDLLDLEFNTEYFVGETTIAVKFAKQAIIDQCGVVGGDGSSCLDCSGVACGDMRVDQCGVCGGDGTACLDCSGTIFGEAKVDQCGVCGGDGNSCLDCAGNPFGIAQADRCGVCNGDGLSCLNCKENDQSETLFRLDGSGATLKHLSYNLAKLVRGTRLNKTAKRRLKKQIRKQADRHFIETWTLAWTIPAKHVDCQASEFCQMIKDTGPSLAYQAKIDEFAKFVKSTSRKLAKKSRPSRAFRAIRVQTEKTQASAQKDLANIATLFYKCE